MNNEQVFLEIEAQQKELNKYSPAFCVGQQLKDIINETPGAAGIVLLDLQQEGMKLTDCERKIKAFADAHKAGNCSCCPPDEAEKIICEFYGISKDPEDGQASGNKKIVSLLDFM